MIGCRFVTVLMAASANPLGNNQEASSAAQKSTSANGGANTPATDTTPTTSALRHNSGISLEWTPDEQSTLEDLLSKLVFFFPVNIGEFMNFFYLKYLILILLFLSVFLLGYALKTCNF